MQAARRLYLYTMSGITLGVIAAGLVILLEVVLEGTGLLDRGPTSFTAAPRERISQAVAMLGVGIPVWAIHWLLIQRGLAIGIKNAADQVRELIDHFDFAIIEDYFFYGWQEKMSPFIKAGKPVFAAEYDDTGVDFFAACKNAGKLGFSIIQKHRILTAYRISCP